MTWNRMTEPTHEITINRVFDAPRELVFRAFVDPDQLARWYGPRGVRTPRETIEFDVRPGGRWSLTMINETDGSEYPTGGVFHEVVEPERLVFTWGDAGPDPEHETVVTLTFADRGDKTEMTLHQSGLTEVLRSFGVHDGWTQALDKLAVIAVSGGPTALSAAQPPQTSITTDDNRSQRSMIMNLPTVVSREEWLTARTQLLASEKAATRARDALNAERRELPMVRVEKDYVFDTADGTRSLPELFEGRRQLIVYHGMWLFDEGQLCPSCSLLIDAMPHLSHLHARDTTVTVVSRGELSDLRGYWKRMGWTVPVASSHGSDFNYDYQATIDPARGALTYNFAEQDGEWSGEVPGTSVFLREGGEVFHTYSSYARGGDAQLGMYTYLDLTPLGRQEDWELPAGRSDGPFMSWVRRHDEY